MSNFEELAKTFKVSTSFVEEEYKKVYAGLVAKGEYTGEALEQQAQALVQHVLRTITKNSKGELFTGMVLAVDRIKDNAASTKNRPAKRQIQMDAYVADPDAALAAGKVAVLIPGENGNLNRRMLNKKTNEVVDDVVGADMWKDYVVTLDNKKIVPLDNMKTWPSGSENFKYLKALPLHEYRTSILVVLKTDVGYKLAEMDYQSEKALAHVPRYVPIEFVAVPKADKGDGVVHLGTSAFTTFSEIKIDFDKTPVELMETFLKGISYPINKLTDYHTQMVKAGKQWDTLVMVKAWISDIRGLEKGTPYLLVNDNTIPADEDDLKVWLHDGIEIDFAKNSQVYIIGRTSQSDKYDSETKTVLKGVPGDVTVWAMDVYTYHNTKPANVKSVSEIVL